MGFFQDVFSNPATGALGGAVGGGALGGPIGAVAGGLVGGAVGAGNQSNQAQQDAAQAQLAQRERERQQAMGFAQTAADYSAPTGQELVQLQAQIDNYSRTMNLQSADLARQEKLINAIDPALIEAGNQALQLLQGKSAPVLSPMLQQRQQDRTKLESTLQSQLGGGYATSTAGIQALNQFDQQTNLLTSQAQQQYAGNLLGVSASVRPNMSGIINQNSQSLNGLSSSILGNTGDIQKRQQNAYTNLGNAAGMNSLVPYAGAPYVGNYLNGQMWGGIFNSATNTLVQGGLAAGSAAAGMPPTGGGGGGTSIKPNNWAGPDTSGYGNVA